MQTRETKRAQEALFPTLASQVPHGHSRAHRCLHCCNIRCVWNGKSFGDGLDVCEGIDGARRQRNKGRVNDRKVQLLQHLKAVERGGSEVRLISTGIPPSVAAGRLTEES